MIATLAFAIWALYAAEVLLQMDLAGKTFLNADLEKILQGQLSKSNGFVAALQRSMGMPTEIKSLPIMNAAMATQCNC